jgi:hypothetical protein
MERSINIDTIGPLLESHSGYKHILVLIDCFTHWVSLYPLTDLTARRTATTLLARLHWDTTTRDLTSRDTGEFAIIRM